MATRGDFPQSSPGEASAALKVARAPGADAASRLCAAWTLAHASRSEDCAQALALIEELRGEKADHDARNLAYLEAMAHLGKGEGVAALRIIRAAVAHAGGADRWELGAHLLDLCESSVSRDAVVGASLAVSAFAVSVALLTAASARRR